MITIKTNISEVTARLISKIQALGGKDVTRTAAIDVLNRMTERIHEQGMAAEGSKLGTYSAPYLKFRARNGRGTKNEIIASFTRQLNNSLNVIGLPNSWGIGVVVQARNPLDMYLNKSNQAKGRNSTKKVSKGKKKGVGKRSLTNGDLIKYLETQFGKKVWTGLTVDEKDLALERVREEVRKILNN